MSWREHATPLLVEIAEQARAVLAEELGLPPDQADYGGYLVMRRIVDHLGGASVYLPKADSVARHERDERIWAQFTGRNHHELARVHGVTTIHIYRLLRRMRQRARAEVQRGLFEGGAAAPGDAADSLLPEGAESLAESARPASS